MTAWSYLVFLLISAHTVTGGPSRGDGLAKIPHSGVEIIHYRFQISINDSTNRIVGKAEITVLMKEKSSGFELDLINRNEAGEGMTTKRVSVNGHPVKFTHDHDRLQIILPSPIAAGQSVVAVIDYFGVPQDGLIISKNKFGDRTFFGDNWPNRARHWLPCIDHPSDKATCEFVIIAPERYAVIANGRKISENSLPRRQRITHWKEGAPIPTKVMVFGAAEFAVQEAGLVNDIAVESWIYPQNKDEGFIDFAMSVKVLDYLQRNIGQYPYEKLASVQSRTRYGGMENASCIFYAENLVNGKKDKEGLIAHEVAHQWFGNSASEKEWPHVWLSEGFATYWSHLYSESLYGPDRLAEEMARDRDVVVAYDQVNPGPVIDTLATDLMSLLNAHSYQKGSWFLHMLRRQIGDEYFYQGMRQYYHDYQNGNALTPDFRRVMEETSHQDLRMFFDQWLRRGGHPRIAGQWKYNPEAGTVTITLRQEQDVSYNTLIDIGLRFEEEKVIITTVQLDSRSKEYTIPAQKKPFQLILDPKTRLLYEGRIDPQ